MAWTLLLNVRKPRLSSLSPSAPASTIIDQPFPKSDLPYTFHTKGAAEIVLDMCSHLVLPSGEVTEMTPEHKAHFTKLLTSLSDQALRAICLAAKPVSDPEVDVTEAEEPGMICLGMVGIQDPLRPGIADAVAACGNAGVTVRMVTGDSLAIAKSIAKECGIYKVGRHEAGTTSLAWFDQIGLHLLALYQT
jgi:Ca2+-transporting ATPase